MPSNIHSTWNLHANSLDLLLISLHNFKVTQRLMRNVKHKFQSCTVLDKISFFSKREKINQMCCFALSRLTKIKAQPSESTSAGENEAPHLSL